MELLSVTYTVKVAAELIVVGVPDKTPALLKLIPAGSPEPVHVYEPVPPDAVNVCVKAELTVAVSASVDDVTVGAPLTVTVAAEDVVDATVLLTRA